MYYLFLFVFVIFSVTPQVSMAAETEFVGDDSLRLAVLDALATHEAAVASGHWIGEVTLQESCTRGEHLREMSGPLELIWKGDRTWGEYSFQELNRLGGRLKSVQYHDRVIRVDGTVSRQDLERGIVYVTQSTSDRVGYVREPAKMRPDERWFRYGTTKWPKYLSIPCTELQNVEVTRSESVRMRDGLIRLLLEYNVDMTLEVFADENQGLNIVKWEGTWNGSRNVGSARWKQTPEGVWYPEQIEYSWPKMYCFDVPEHFVLKTTSFESNPDINPKLFDWRTNLPKGTKYQIVRADGTHVMEGVHGQGKTETAQEVLDRLAKEAKSGFAVPNKK
ncbi:MAG: hypothetical protein R3C18_11495 [Planctomycetaceae bacterium]